MNSALVSGALPLPPQPASAASASTVPANGASDRALARIRGRVAAPRPAGPGLAIRVAALSAGRIYRDTLRNCASRPGFLIALGALVFVPLGLLDAAVDRAGSIH